MPSTVRSGGQSSRRRLIRPLLPVLVVSALALAGCGGSDADTAVTKAEAQVTAKEKALASAQGDAEAATAAFCDTSKTYVVALDRYGDVLTSTAPTVGDVNDAGADLADPGADAAQAREDALAARDELKAAKQDLKEAEAALEDAQASAGVSSSAAGPDESTSASALPALPPTKTVDRVKQAEAEFETARAGITDQTPLVQASQQFNAAAVALEMSWLRLYSDAGCLADEQQEQAVAAAADYTLTLQQALATAGYYQGEADGIYGPETVDAVEALQKDHGLPVTGTVDKATADALESDLQAKGGAAADEAIASTAAVQQTLKLAGYWDGPVDGTWTPELTDALMAFQTDLGVEPTGTVDAATVAAAEQALADLQSPEPSPSVTESASESAPAAGATDDSEAPES